MASLMQLLALLALTPLLVSAGDWQNGRTTWFEVENNDLTTANCHLRWDQIKTGSYVGAFSDNNPLFESSCGLCVEMRCQNADFKDGYGNYLDRRSACYDPAKSVFITIADACPCKYPNNQYSNQRWCCGDDSSRQHIDITKDAFAKLADLGKGVIGMQWRVVDCGSVPSSKESYYSDAAGSGSNSDTGSSNNNNNQGSTSSGNQNSNQGSQYQQPQQSSQKGGFLGGILGRWFGRS